MEPRTKLIQVKPENIPKTQLERRPNSGLAAQRVEGRAHLGAVGLRLLPGGEVTALGEAVVVDELGIGSLGPAGRGGVDFVRKRADGLGTAVTPLTSKKPFVAVALASQ
jgi:hypothetical protein